MSSIQLGLSLKIIAILNSNKIFMKIDVINTLTNNFEMHAQQTEEGVEFWLARDLQQLLGYDE